MATELTSADDPPAYSNGAKEAAPRESSRRITRPATPSLTSPVAAGLCSPNCASHISTHHDTLMVVPPCRAAMSV